MTVNLVNLVDIVNELPRHPTKKYSQRKLSDIVRLVLHTTDANWTPLQVAEYDTRPNHLSSTGAPGCTYHRIVTKDGTCYRTLDEREVSWHVGIWNPGSLAIAMSFRCTDKQGKDTIAPELVQLDNATELLAQDCLNLGLKPYDSIVGHRELKFTGWIPLAKGGRELRKTCPSMQVNLDSVRRNAAMYVQDYLKQIGLYKLKVDGTWGPKTEAAWKEFQRTNVR